MELLKLVSGIKVDVFTIIIITKKSGNRKGKPEV